MARRVQAEWSMDERNRTSSYEVGLAAGRGTVSGLLAAVVMAMFATVVSAAQGAGAFAPVQLIGGTFVSDIAARPVLATVLGVASHMVVGAAAGALFAIATVRLRSTPLVIAAALGYSAVIFVAALYAVLPLLNPAMASTLDPGWFFAYHLAFGAVLAASLQLGRTHPTSRWFEDPGHSHG